MLNKVLLATAIILSFSANAEQITLPLSAESESGKTRYCFYENSNYSFTYEVRASQSCPFTRTFNLDEDEE